MTFIVKIGKRLLKNFVFSLQKPLFPYSVFVASLICNTTLILLGDNAWMCVSRVYNWEIWNQFGKRQTNSFVLFFDWRTVVASLYKQERS